MIEAAGFLGNAELRKHALARVEGIREYQDASDRWAARKTSRQNRETVLAALIAMLDDGDPVIRVEAIRGLGTFEAAEYLPRLILLLKESKPEIREAAREAIDRIHAGSKAQAK